MYANLNLDIHINNFVFRNQLKLSNEIKMVLSHNFTHFIDRKVLESNFETSNMLNL